MAIELTASHPRRAILAAAGAALATFVAQALGRAVPARAVDGQAVLVGGEYTSSSVTKITNLADFSPAIQGASSSGFGVYGVSSSGFGVYGTSDSSLGVYGTSDSEAGVYGTSKATNRPAITGESWVNSTGVLGYSGGGGIPPSGVAKTGVYGYAVQDAGSRGVWGRSNGGYGVYGSAGTGTGVRGVSTSGIGVRSSSASSVQPALSAQSSGHNTAVFGFSGTSGLLPPPATPARTGVYGYAVQDASSKGVYGRSGAGLGVYGQASSGSGLRGYATSGRAISAEATTGIALHAKGRVQLEQSSGSATIAAGTKTKMVSPGFDLTATSKVLVTLNGNPGGTTVLQRVAINATANSFTVVLSAVAANNTRFSWLVLV